MDFTLIQYIASGDSTAAASASLVSGFLSAMAAIFGLFFMMWWLAIFIAFLSFIGMILALVDCVRREFPNPNDKLLWVIIILFGSLIGTLLYFFLVYQKQKEKTK